MEPHETKHNEVQTAEKLLSGIPLIDTTRRSVEEIAALIVHSSQETPSN